MGLTDTVRAVLDHKGIGVCAVMPETPVYEALEIMADKDIGAVLVMEDADLCGIFSERDYARKVILQGKASRDTTVGEIMTSPPVVTTLEQSVDDCLRVMTDHRIRHLAGGEPGGGDRSAVDRRSGQLDYPPAGRGNSSPASLHYRQLSGLIVDV